MQTTIYNKNSKKMYNKIIKIQNKILLMFIKNNKIMLIIKIEVSDNIINKQISKSKDKRGNRVKTKLHHQQNIDNNHRILLQSRNQLSKYRIAAKQI